MPDYGTYHGHQKGGSGRRPSDLVGHNSGGRGLPKWVAACSVCGGPMFAGQQRWNEGRHATCGETMPCCDALADLVPNQARHHKASHHTDRDPYPYPGFNPTPPEGWTNDPHGVLP